MIEKVGEDQLDDRLKNGEILQRVRKTGTSYIQ